MKQFLLAVPLSLCACALSVGERGIKVSDPTAAPTAPVAAQLLPPPPSIPEDPPPLPPAPAGELAIAKGNREFAVSLYRQLASKPGNIFISPISIAGVFGPIAAGARGKTRAEIGEILRYPVSDDVLNANLGSMLRTLETRTGGPQVTIANALWMAKDSSIEPDFIELAKRSYGAEVDTLDFNRPGAATTQINNWVDRATNGRIPELFAPGTVDKGTTVALTNAVYFLGDWKLPFPTRNTRPQPFYRADGTTPNVPMMASERFVHSYALDDVELLELPYKGDRLSMVVILPTDRNGLPAVEAALSAARLESWLRTIDATNLSQLSIHLPRLQIESSYELRKPLEALGVKLAFQQSSADFTGISKDRGDPLFITDVVHKTFLKVDETGTEAAAATGVLFSGERDHPEFIADHPFLFLIRDKQTGALLFMGRFAGP